MLLPVDFDYFRPATLREALELLSAHGPKARIMAGGTDLVLEMKRGEAAPEVLVDVTAIPELRVLECDDQVLRIGAACTFAAICTSPYVRDYAPALAAAAGQVGSPQIRARGTIGGNVGTRSPAGDALPPLVAHGAEAVVVSGAGARTVRIEEILSGAERLEPGELIRDFRIPRREGVKGVFVKLGRRNALAIARLSLALVAHPVEAGGDARVALGTLGIVPVRVPEAEDLMNRRGLDPAAWPEMAEAASRAVERSIPGRPTAPYKMRAVKGIIYEALENMSRG
jgi:carbon-monoxide dehydrogenase medium subunit